MANTRVLTGRAEIPHREWVEFDFHVNGENLITDIHFRTNGCFDMIAAAKNIVATQKGRPLSQLSHKGANHWDILIREVFERVNGTFKFPNVETEVCHCRRIPATRIDEAIILGAHTPEQVTAWTTASSGCGTCRPEVEKIIAFRLKGR